MGIISPFGDNSDKASFGIMLIFSMPMLPLLFFAFYSNGGITTANIMQVVSLLIPFILGMILGNLDMDIKKVFAGGNAIILPFLGFEFGSTINLVEAVKKIPQGLLLSVIFFIIVIVPSYLVERFIMKRPGYASVASGSLAGVALSIPLMVDQVTFGSYATDAIAILAFVLAITNILCPFLTRWNNKYYQKKHPERAKEIWPELNVEIKE